MSFYYAINIRQWISALSLHIPAFMEKTLFPKWLNCCVFFTWPYLMHSNTPTACRSTGPFYIKLFLCYVCLKAYLVTFWLCVKNLLVSKTSSHLPSFALPVFFYSCILLRPRGRGHFGVWAVQTGSQTFPYIDSTLPTMPHNCCRNQVPLRFELRSLEWEVRELNITHEHICIIRAGLSYTKDI